MVAKHNLTTEGAKICDRKCKL